jgi:hypothetical protein
MESKVALPIAELVKSLTKEQQDKVLAYIQEMLDDPFAGVKNKDQKWIAFFGSMKGKVWISDDFDEPIEDFKDYM